MAAEKENVTLRVPLDALERADKLAEDQDISRAEILNRALSTGLNTLEEEHYGADNKRRINERLRHKEAEFVKAVAVLSATPVARDEERQAAIAVIREYLA